MTQPCPECATPLPVDPRYVTWCHECEWNLSLPPAQHAPSERRLDRLLGAAGRRLGERLAAELMRTAELRPRVTPAKAAAYAIALAVHALVLLVIAAGVWLILGLGGLFPIIGGVLLLGLAFLMRPRLGKRPKDVLAREAAPALYGLVDQIADGLETRRVNWIETTDDYNAGWTIVGVRRERVLTLGLPLLHVLEPQEQVALIAHELAHGRNGDSTRGLVVGSAIGSLSELEAVLRPEPAGSEFGDADFLDVVTRPLTWLLAQPVRLLLRLELLLLMRDSQRAEFLADDLAARVAGTAAVIGLHEKLLLEHTVAIALQHVALAPAGDRADALERMRSAFADVPERERERRRRLARLEAATLGATHPPTGQRLALLESRPALPATVSLGAEAQRAIEEELAPGRARVSRHLVEQYRAALHG